MLFFKEALLRAPQKLSLEDVRREGVERAQKVRNKIALCDDIGDSNECVQEAAIWFAIEMARKYGISKNTAVSWAPSSRSRLSNPLYQNEYHIQRKGCLGTLVEDIPPGENPPISYTILHSEQPGYPGDSQPPREAYPFKTPNGKYHHRGVVCVYEERVRDEFIDLVYSLSSKKRSKPYAKDTGILTRKRKIGYPEFGGDNEPWGQPHESGGIFARTNTGTGCGVPPTKSTNFGPGKYRIVTWK